MDSVAIEGVGTGYLVQGYVCLKDSAGELLLTPVPVVTPGYMSSNALQLATETEAATLEPPIVEPPLKPPDEHHKDNEAEDLPDLP